MRSSRRAFLEHLASGACACSVAADAADQPHRPDLAFPSRPTERLSVTSYPFRAYIDSPTNRGRKRELPGMDLTRFPALMADKFDVHNVNPLIEHFRSTEAAYLEAFRKALSNAHSHIVDLGLPGGHFYSSDRSARQSAVEFGRKWIDIARIIGSPSIRQHISGKRGERPKDGLAAESLGQLAEYGARHNVVVNLENDNPVAEDPFFLVRVIEKVGNPYLRALPDFGNSLIGHDDQYNERAVTAMFKHVFNMCHVKDEVESDEGARSAVDLKKMFGIAKASGYRGYFSMEYETKLGDPFAGTKKLIEETLTYLA